MTWTTQKPAVAKDGEVGGDGAGESWSVRWIKSLPDGTFAAVTSYYYPVDSSARGDGDPESSTRFGVENAIFYSYCTDQTDVGGSETSADTRFVGVASDLTEQQAIEQAERAAHDEASNGYLHSHQWLAQD